MIVRTATLIFSLILFVSAFILQILVPAVSVYVFYGLLAWLIASLFIFRLPVMSRSIGSPRPVAAGGGVSRTPLPSGGVGTSLGFCPFCAASVPPGTAVCPECHRGIAQF